jgi:hypothetical protein
MNRLQRIFLVCGLVGVVSLCLFPPWDYAIWTEPISEHHWVFDPPSLSLRPPNSRLPPPQIAFSRLGLEAGAVAGITAVAVVLAGWRRKAKQPN